MSIFLFGKNDEIVIFVGKKMAGYQQLYTIQPNNSSHSVVSVAVSFGRKIYLFYHLTTNFLAGQFREGRNFC